ncbi:hypothetical protein [Ktedonospora formicarum]|uniref:Uncharacterized protein n=1 Tax=Ktedonospora formicarum TaxID=2778364 RepID=A0A8J3HZC8_9CHLR|nr:hypothetical protein [Ktedonospora formicarum]GHO43432.1 hypothetical protein KSX_15950 [Ktedonospora formicarum]
MRGAMRNALIAGAVIFAVLAVCIIAAAWFGVLLETVYIFLMLLAAILVVATFMQIYWVASLIRAIATVRDEVKPLVSSVQETVGIVQDTAKTAGHTASIVSTVSNLASELVVAPGVRATAGAVAAGEMLKVFFGKGSKKSKYEERILQQAEEIRASGGGD